MFRVSTSREQVSSVGRPFAHAMSFAASRPGFLARLSIALGAIVLTAIGVIVLVPIILIGLFFALCVVVGVALRVWLARARGPNGALDGRRNVRVRGLGEPTRPTP